MKKAVMRTVEASPKFTTVYICSITGQVFSFWACLADALCRWQRNGLCSWCIGAARRRGRKIFRFHRSIQVELHSKRSRRIYSVGTLTKTRARLGRQRRALGAPGWREIGTHVLWRTVSKAFWGNWTVQQENCKMARAILYDAFYNNPRVRS